MTGFDIGKWFDEFENHEGETPVIASGLILQMRYSFGEKSLKEWFDSEYGEQLKVEDSLEAFLKYFKYDFERPWKGCADFAKMAVSCLGEKRCLELLKKWWEEKK